MNSPTNMPIAPYAHVRHTEAFRRCRHFGKDEVVRVISTHNPWRPGSRAFNLFEKVLRAKPVTTIQQIVEDAEAFGYYSEDTKRHLRWLYTWGDFIEVNGARYFPVQETAPVEKQTRSKRKTKRS